jgi:hypothetical protein
MLMAIGQITGLKTWLVLMGRSIKASICWKDSRILDLLLKTQKTLSLQGLLHQHGIEVQMELNGTKNTVSHHGINEQRSQERAQRVEKPLKHGSSAKSSVVQPAPSAFVIGKIKQPVLHAANAVVHFLTVVTALKRTVLVSVQTSTVAETNVYNLTLDRDNVYYANGVLVENCADALAVTFASKVTPSSLKNYIEAEFTVTQKKWNPLGKVAGYKA